MLGDKLIENTYTWVKYSLGILYLLTLFGIWSSAPKYLKIIDLFFNIIVGGILIYFFNPLKKTICTPFHRRVVFSAGLAIILQSSLIQYLNPIIVEKAKNVVNNVVS